MLLRFPGARLAVMKRMLTYQCFPNHLDNSHHKLLLHSSIPLSDQPSLVSRQLRVVHLMGEGGEGKLKDV